MSTDWTPVESYKDVPMGFWLVKLETDMKCKYAILKRHENGSVVGDHFAFDSDRVIAYRSIPE
jgi:hypothetical protein